MKAWLKGAITFGVIGSIIPGFFVISEAIESGLKDSLRIVPSLLGVVLIAILLGSFVGWLIGKVKEKKSSFMKGLVWGFFIGLLLDVPFGFLTILGMGMDCGFGEGAAWFCQNIINYTLFLLLWILPPLIILSLFGALIGWLIGKIKSK